MGLQPFLAFCVGYVVPWVAGLWGIGSEVAAQRVHTHLPEVFVLGEAASPTGSGPAVEMPVWNGGTITDGALRGDRGPGFWPGGFIAARGTLAAVGQVGLDEGSCGTGLLWRATAGTDAITAHAVDCAILRDKIAGRADGDLGIGHGRPPCSS